MHGRSLYRTLAILLFVGAMLVPLACNTPAPVSGPEAEEGEGIWEWLEIFAAYRSLPPRPTSTITLDPTMVAMNQALAAQMQSGTLEPLLAAQDQAYLAPQGDFKCDEEVGLLLRWMDPFPSEPSQERNSLLNRSSVFALLEDESGGFGLSWQLSYEALHVVRDYTDNAGVPSTSHDRESYSAAGRGTLDDLGLGQYSGTLSIDYERIEDPGNKYEYSLSDPSGTDVYYVAGLYDPSAKTMYLCLVGSPPLLTSRSQELLAGGVPVFRAWCLGPNESYLTDRSYFVCEPTEFLPGDPFLGP